VSPEAAQIRLWRNEPWTFARQVLRQEPDDWQDDFYHALVGLHVDLTPLEKRLWRFALQACKGPGKTGALASFMWWFKVCFLDSKLAATSITGDNLRDNLWAELAKWQQHSRLLMAAYEWTEDRVYERGRGEVSFMAAREWPRSASPEKMAETLAGFHGDNVAFVVDESGGVPRAVMAAADAVLANADPAQGRVAYVAQAGNPTTPDGPLYDACVKDRPLWWVREITGDPDDPRRAKRVSIEWAREQIAMHPGGRTHPWVMVNVLAKFPPGGANNLISVNDCMEAAARAVSPHEWQQDAKVMGVDIARFGTDETVIAYRQGPVAFKMRAFRNQNLMATAGQVAMSIDRWKPHAVFIDVTGIGAGVVDRLVQLRYPVTAVNFGEAALGFSHVEWKLKNRREEMWWAMAEWIKHAAIPDDSQLRADLAAPTYKFTADNRIELERKDDMKKRGLPSPDRADALALTFAEPVPHRGLRSVADKLEDDREMQDRQRGKVRRGNNYNPIAKHR
jgi:phage terminase large subunit